MNDIAAGTLAGLAAGAFGAVMLPDAPIKECMIAGGATGFARGLLVVPFKWLLNRRPPPNQGE
ncbi:MAG TPA: hypothetical protein VGD79_07965 [Thermoanaerobaculia bacterium]